eukprot:5025852-Lingulodinium_polyedra.AAC.1
MRSPPVDGGRFDMAYSTPPSGNPYGPRRRHRRDEKHTVQSAVDGSSCARAQSNVAVNVPGTRENAD